MRLVDTHTHLYVEDFDTDQTAVVERAIRSGVERFYIPAISSAYTHRMLALEAKFPERIRLMMGLHPTHVKENYLEELEAVQNQLESREFVAVGEIGIDLYWETKYLKEQQDAFHKQIEWAKAKGLPIVIHCRSAFDAVFEVLEAHRDAQLYGVFHCFSGTLAQAKCAMDFNLKLGIGGVLTFKNGKIDQFLHEIPLTAIVLETDAPYLAPVPYRGKRNESSYLLKILEKMADVYQEPISFIAEQTTQNAYDVFENKGFKR